MTEFPRTVVGGVSLPRMIIGSNWFMGYSHTSRAQDLFIKDLQTQERIAEIVSVFLEYGIDAIVAGPTQYLHDALRRAEDRTGRKVIRMWTPSFNITPGGPAEDEPEAAFDRCRSLEATFCMPHQCVTDALIDRMSGQIRHMDQYSRMIRERGMIPGLSTHMPEAIVLADKTDADVETYIQIYNAAGFLMQVEVDWVMRVIHRAKKPVLTIKPLAAGRLMPVVGLTFVWNTIRPQDMVSVGTTTADEAREVIELSLQLIEGKLPTYELQRTRSKRSLD
ncbi:MAG: hypothetical protein GX601_19555 [Anaerolineales bacterium]|nr:hypothetical protein [Anaerolineales bacterium]